MKKLLLVALLLGGCAHFNGSDGWTPNTFHYYDAEPYMAVSISTNCQTTASIVMVPSHKESVEPVGGYGSTNLSIAFQNGMIASIGQTQDAKIPETITALTGSVAQASKLMGVHLGATVTPVTCPAQVTMYPITDGKVDGSKPLTLNIH